MVECGVQWLYFGQRHIHVADRPGAASTGRKRWAADYGANPASMFSFEGVEASVWGVSAGTSQGFLVLDHILACITRPHEEIALKLRIDMLPKSFGPSFIVAWPNWPSRRVSLSISD